MKKRITCFITFGLLFNSNFTYGAENKFQPRNSLELGARNILNWNDGSGWVGESNNLYSIFSYTRISPKYKILAGTDYYHYETFKLRQGEDIFNLAEYREFQHIRLFAGKYIETERIIASAIVNLNYLFGGFEGRYFGIPYHMYGHSTMKGFGYGGGFDVKYKIKKKYTVGLNINYSTYSLKRTFRSHREFEHIFGNPLVYNENTPGVDIYNSMWSLHFKFGLLL